MSSERMVEVKSWRCDLHGTVCFIDDHHPSETRRQIELHRKAAACARIYDQVVHRIPLLSHEQQKKACEMLLQSHKARLVFNSTVKSLRENLGLTAVMAEDAGLRLVLSCFKEEAQ